MKTKEEYNRSAIKHNARMYELAKLSIEECCYTECYVPDVIPEVIPLVENYKQGGSLDELYDYFMNHKDIITIYDIYYLLVFDDSYKHNNFFDTDIYDGQWFKDFRDEVVYYYKTIEQYWSMAKRILDGEKLTINKLLCSFLVANDEYNTAFMDVVKFDLKAKRDHDILIFPETAISSTFQLCLMAEFDRFMGKMCQYIEKVNNATDEDDNSESEK